MTDSTTPDARYRPLVGELVAALDAQDDAAFRGAFERLRDLLNVELNPELRRITESAQSALERFRDELRLETLAGQEVPDARKRLAHVVQLTDEAAHRTLDLVEQSGPLVDQTARGAAGLLDEWRAQAAWPADAPQILERAVRDCDQVRGHLSEMLLAQGYQDMTGQIIRSVNSLVGELEHVLAKLVALVNGEETRRMPALRLPQADSAEDLRRGIGPQIEGVGSGNAVSGQDDIDALLASMAAGK